MVKPNVLPKGLAGVTWAGMRPLTAGIVVGLLCFSVAFFVVRSEDRHARQEGRASVRSNLALLRANLEREIVVASSLGSVLTTDVAITGHMDAKRFDRLSREILAGSRVVRHVGLSEGMVMRWVHPLVGNEAAIGQNYRDVPAQLRGVIKAINSRSAVLVGPLTLAEGTRALVIQRPIFLSPPNQRPQSGPFWGILTLVLNAEALFGAADLLEPDLPVAVALRRTGDTNPKAVLLGSPDLFKDPEAVVLPVTLPEGQWDLVGRPKAGWDALTASRSEVLLFAGGLLSLVVGVAAFGGVTWLDRKHDAERRLRVAKVRAEQVLDELTSTRAELAQAERLSSLGALVESVTHEVSNPLSTSLTAATFLEESAQDLERRFHDKTLRRLDMEEFLRNAKQVSEITARNLTRAAQLIESFKQVAVDQASDARRSLDLCSWLEDVRVSLTPRLNRTPHVLEIHCPDGVIMDTRPGALFQVITQLVIGALDHVYESKTPMTLRLSVTVEEGNRVALVFQDESAPVAPEDIASLSEGGGTVGGCGYRSLASCQGLVTGPLMGVMSGRPGSVRGNTFVLRLPRVLPA